jgi:hypothetical protein
LHNGSLAGWKHEECLRCEQSPATSAAPVLLPETVCD